MKSLYSDTPTWLHRVPASVKLIGLMAFSLVLFQVQRLDMLLGVSLFVMAAFASLGRCAASARRFLTSLALACGLLMAFHGIMGQPQVGGITVLRLISATLMGLALTLTTRQTDLLIFFEAALRPLRFVGVQPERLSLHLALMLRFIEHFFSIWHKLDEAHRLRTGKTGGFKILAPLTIQILLAARRVADALFVRLHRSP